MSTSQAVFPGLVNHARLVDIIQRTPDLIKSHRSGKSCKGGMYLTNTLNPYKSHKVGKSRKAGQYWQRLLSYKALAGLLAI
jgi:hypothetical protein